MLGVSVSTRARPGAFAVRRFVLKVRKRSAVAAAAISLLMVMIATPAQAADFTIHSTTWKSSVYYNDSANTLRLCDVVDRDGDGAHISTSLGHSTWVYNGCTWLQNIPDGVRWRSTCATGST